MVNWYRPIKGPKFGGFGAKNAFYLQKRGDFRGCNKLIGREKRARERNPKKADYRSANTIKLQQNLLVSEIIWADKCEFPQLPRKFNKRRRVEFLALFRRPLALLQQQNKPQRHQDKAPKTQTGGVLCYWKNRQTNKKPKWKFLQSRL